MGKIGAAGGIQLTWCDLASGVGLVDQALRLKGTGSTGLQEGQVVGCSWLGQQYWQRTG